MRTGIVWCCRRSIVAADDEEEDTVIDTDADGVSPREVKSYHSYHNYYNYHLLTLSIGWPPDPTNENPYRMPALHFCNDLNTL